MPNSTVTVDVHLHPGEMQRALREDVRRGLTQPFKELPPKWFYDERGSQLFDEITRLPEYYPTRREREILIARSDEIAALASADTLVELGSGTSEKTRLLLQAMYDRRSLRRFVPFDVSEEILRESARQINGEFGALQVHAVCGDFDRHLPEIPNGDRRLIAFLGGTIGNFPPEQRAVFLADLADSMHSGDCVLIGFDLVKDIGRLEAAYNDSAGVTAEFNRNVLHVINRELGANFDVDSFEHVAYFDTANEWIEMRLRSPRDHTIRIDELDLAVPLAAGEEIRTEISAKFRPERIRAELGAAGLDLVETWTDVQSDFALALARPR